MPGHRRLQVTLMVNDAINELELEARGRQAIKEMNEEEKKSLQKKKADDSFHRKIPTFT